MKTIIFRIKGERTYIQEEESCPHISLELLLNLIKDPCNKYAPSPIHQYNQLHIGEGGVCRGASYFYLLLRKAHLHVCVRIASVKRF